ncbi:hypothetical protein ABW19_dt0205669 [Dactylella cylindrospora]|nr:hypothetical protein ABW19_dt0205669 [Dactylella cylindrospora]
MLPNACLDSQPPCTGYRDRISKLDPVLGECITEPDQLGYLLVSYDELVAALERAREAGSRLQSEKLEDCSVSNASDEIPSEGLKTPTTISSFEEPPVEPIGVNEEAEEAKKKGAGDLYIIIENGVKDEAEDEAYEEYNVTALNPNWGDLIGNDQPGLRHLKSDKKVGSLGITLTECVHSFA